MPFSPAYATWCGNGLNEDVESSYRYGKLAVCLLKMLGSNRFTARVFIVVYSLVNIRKEPLQCSMDKLLEGYNAGCVYGDIEYGYWNLQAYSSIALYSSQNLVTLQQDMRSYIKRAIQCNQVTVLLGILPLLFTALELTGEASREDICNKFLHTTEDALIEYLKYKNELRACILMWNCRKYSCIFKGDMAGAVKIYAVWNHNQYGVRLRTIPYFLNVFADGIISFYMAREHGHDEQQWTKAGQGKIETMRKWTYHGSKWNFENKLYLLEAEYFFLKGK